MPFSLIHTETGSSSQFKLFSFEQHRLIQSLFGYHYHTPSLMERFGALPNRVAISWSARGSPRREKHPPRDDNCDFKKIVGKFFPILDSRGKMAILEIDKRWYMFNSSAKVFYWIPRILGIFMAVFISLFALDVFTGQTSIWQEMLGLIIHLIPTYLVLIALAISWRWERVGGTLFVLLGLLYVITNLGNTPWSVNLVIAGPAILIGGLFWVSYYVRRQSLPSPQ